MSFTHDTLINALRDVIREEIRTQVVEILRDEASDLSIEITRMIESMIESNGTFSNLADRLDRLDSRLDDAETAISNIDDDQPDWNDIDSRLDDLESKVGDTDCDDLYSNVRIVEERLSKMKDIFYAINDATTGISHL